MELTIKGKIPGLGRQFEISDSIELCIVELTRVDCMLMGLQYERPWLKGQRSTLTFSYLFIDTRLNISNEIMILASTVFKKQLFKKFPIQMH